jgi:acid phosphatase family membrane protein YuiD
MDSFPQVLATAVGVQIACQIFKLVVYSIRDGQLRMSYLVTAGGIPSAHSAFVSALAVAIGMRNGFTSDLFAVAFVFSAIVIYDAFRLRGHVQRHAEILNERLLRPAGESPISEMVGHSVPEIVAGIAFGGGIAALVTSLVG